MMFFYWKVAKIVLRMIAMIIGMTFLCLFALWTGLLICSLIRPDIDYPSFIPEYMFLLSFLVLFWTESGETLILREGKVAISLPFDLTKKDQMEEMEKNGVTVDIDGDRKEVIYYME